MYFSSPDGQNLLEAFDAHTELMKNTPKTNQVIPLTPEYLAQFRARKAAAQAQAQAQAAIQALVPPPPPPLAQAPAPAPAPKRRGRKAAVAANVEQAQVAVAKAPKARKPRAKPKPRALPPPLPPPIGLEIDGLQAAPVFDYPPPPPPLPAKKGGKKKLAIKPGEITTEQLFKLIIKNSLDITKATRLLSKMYYTDITNYVNAYLQGNGLPAVVVFPDIERRAAAKTAAAAEVNDGTDIEGDVNTLFQ